MAAPRDQQASDFEWDASAAEFAVSKTSYLDTHSDAAFDHIAVSTFVLDTSSTSDARLLLVQRAASDSNPNLWEPPGGACDEDDKTILHAAQRELWEEAGLRAARISGPVGCHYFTTRRAGKKVCQFAFVVHLALDGKDVLPAVKLDPEEHQAFVWVREEQVVARKAGDIALNFTSEEVARMALLVLEEANKVRL